MKVFEILEGLNRVPKRDVDNPHPSHRDDPDMSWIHGSDKINASDVIRNILGDKATFDDDPSNDDQFVVSRPWVNHFQTGMFSSMDMPPGKGGAIGIPNLTGNKPGDIAVAAHEAFHALLQSRSKNPHNEKVVNRLATRWLQDHLSGMFLHMALERIGRSKRSYEKFKYETTRKYLAAYKEDNE